MKFFFTSLLFCIFSYSYTLSAANLDVQINGVDDAELENINLYLGELPDTDSERSNFIFSAKTNTVKALQAFGYFQSKVTTTVDRTNQPWQLSIEIVLNDKVVIRDINIQLQGEAQNEVVFQKILSQHPFTSGTALDQQKYESLKSLIQNKGLELGFFDAELLANSIKINQVNNFADIELIYHSGDRYRFGEVLLDDIDLEPWLLESLIPFQPGDWYSVEKLNLLQNQLQQSNYLSAVSIVPQIDQAQKLEVPVKVKFKPAKSHSFDIGLGFATDTKERLTFAWKTPQINRYGHNQEAKIAYSSINPSGEIKYNIPISHPYNDILQFGLRLEDDDFGAISSKQYAAQVNRIKNENGWIRTYFVRYQKELWDSNEINLQANYVLPGVSLSRTTKSGTTIDPSHGFSQLYTLEATTPSIGSDTQLLRFTSKLKWVSLLAAKHRVVARTHLGIIQVAEDDINLVAPSLRFFAGGDQSIRGFAYQSLGPSETRVDADGKPFQAVIGGSRIATASLEYQYYFNDNWRLPLFFDIGDAFNNENFTPVYSVGTGIHYLSPIGAIRIEVGYGISEDNPPWRIHFTMGAEL